MQIGLKAFLTTITVVFLSVTPASAEGMTGIQFKKMVIGNTLHQKVWSNRRGEELEYMYYFINDRKLLFSSAQSAPTATYDWNVSDDGKFCFISTYRRTREVCHHDFRVEGKTLIGIRSNRKARKRKFTLLKGKHEVAKRREYQ